MKREILYLLKSKKQYLTYSIIFLPILPMLLVPNIPKKSKIE